MTIALAAHIKLLSRTLRWHHRRGSPPARWLSEHVSRELPGVALPGAPVYLVAHELLRSVPRVRVVWDALLAWAQAYAANGGSLR